MKWNVKDVKEIIDECDMILNHKSKLVIKHNGKLKSTLARYISRNNKEKTPIAIEVGTDIMNVPDRKALSDVVKHEYAHYYSMSVLKTSNGHDREFRRVCKLLGTENDKAKCNDFIKKQLIEARQPSQEQEMAFYKMLKRMMEQQQKQTIGSTK